jgi:hypothetical protein
MGKKKKRKSFPSRGIPEVNTRRRVFAVRNKRNRKKDVLRREFKEKE